MMLTSLILALAVFSAGSAQAACFAAYKAKQDAPLRLHYGVIQLALEPCEASGEAERQIAERIARDGWTLLQLVRMVGAEEVESERDDAGAYFLRY